MKILLVEDNPILRENLIFLLKKFSYLVESVENGKIAYDKIISQKFQAIILDVNMPVMNGKEFLAKIRKDNISIPVIALTSDSMLQDKLEMFELWVDDYLTKPFEIEELVARLKSLLKRWEQKIDDEKISWNLKINYSKNKIYFKNNEVNFPHKQYLILEFLMNNIWYPQNKVKIMEYVWWESEENLDLNSTTLESHIYAIRKIIGKDIINTVKGIWYIIEK